MWPPRLRGGKKKELRVDPPSPEASARQPPLGYESECGNDCQDLSGCFQPSNGRNGAGGK